jgi:hypothetical protein
MNKGGRSTYATHQQTAVMAQYPITSNPSSSSLTIVALAFPSSRVRLGSLATCPFMGNFDLILWSAVVVAGSLLRRLGRGGGGSLEGAGGYEVVMVGKDESDQKLIEARSKFVQSSFKVRLKFV